ncbi:phosphotransferase enzyme family protein [Emericellopsis atlantica]|uniref:Phosphotransferase enzyme family protein n=1 Tax=Emericellopsis atlantica TaxID=2614577 RepID=A0A9P7ZFU2_9HYPO|nr:phosphotransferase enzyme family protein [Emericellopsis atlantica]KAG9251344.1 phosphotransferase enzyme family protein [Emericellopsis atlantica]
MAPNGTCEPCIDMSNMVDISKDQMDFIDTSFFQSNESPGPQLPTPASIIQRYGDGGARVVKIEEQNMAVKINDVCYLRLEEEVPVPEIRRDLSSVIRALRKIPPNPSNLIGTTLSLFTRAMLTFDDRRFFRLNHEGGPFSSIKSFNNWLFAITTHQTPGPDGVRNLEHPDLYRDLLPDTGRIYFTHGDLTLGNIIVSGAPGVQRVKGIIDWEQAGWYPEYWEYCKMLYGVELGHEWRTDDWPDNIVKPFEDAFFAFADSKTKRTKSARRTACSTSLVSQCVTFPTHAPDDRD